MTTLCYQLSPLKNDLFSAVKLVINTSKSKFIYSGWEIAYDEKSSWSFGDNFARNVVIFDTDNGSIISYW